MLSSARDETCSGVLYVLKWGQMKSRQVDE